MPSEPEYLPTPEDIEFECALIRAGWKESQFEDRASCHAKPWTVPVAKHHRQ